MGNEIQRYQHQIPTVADLQKDMESAMGQDKLNIICNQPTPVAWLKQNKFVKVKVGNQWKQADYLPIDKVKYLLTRIFGRWRLEIKSVELKGNSIMAMVRVWVWNPTYLEWDYHDGVGAVAVQQDAGADQTDIEAVKKNAFQIGSPAAVSFALKDAAQNFGTIFGGALNKDNALYYAGQFSEITVTPKAEEPSQNNNGTAGSNLNITTEF